MAEPSSRASRSGPLDRARVERLEGPALLEFGSGSCGWCRAARPLIAGALAVHPRVHHIQVEDGSGQPLGRSYGVKLWPTLVFLDHGRETARLVRPSEGREIEAALSAIDPIP